MRVVVLDRGGPGISNHGDSVNEIFFFWASLPLSICTLKLAKWWCHTQHDKLTTPTNTIQTVAWWQAPENSTYIFCENKTPNLAHIPFNTRPDCNAAHDFYSQPGRRGQENAGAMIRKLI